jgi:hypothetical protein
MRVVGRIALIGITIAGAWLASGDASTFLFYASYMTAGAVLVALRPRNVVGWLLIVVAFGFIATTLPPDVDLAAVRRGDGTTLDSLIVWIVGWAGLASYVGFMVMTVVFPTGRIPDRGRRTSTILLVAGVVLVVLAATAPTVSISATATTTVDVPNPLPILPNLPIWSIVPIESLIWPSIFALLIIGVVRLVLRYRRATGVERLQLRWLVAAVVFLLAGVLIAIGLILAFGDQADYAWIVAAFAYPTVPLAIGVAVLRYRLLEIDRIISRTIAYAGVSAVLFAVFAAVNLGLQAVLGSFVNGNAAAVAISTLVVAALFNPVRVRLQSAVDRRFNRSRYDHEHTARSFAAAIRDEVDLTALQSTLASTADDAVKSSRVGVWLRPPHPRRA